jgi:hypothetical protein
MFGRRPLPHGMRRNDLLPGRWLRLPPRPLRLLELSMSTTRSLRKPALATVAILVGIGLALVLRQQPTGFAVTGSSRQKATRWEGGNVRGNLGTSTAGHEVATKLRIPRIKLRPSSSGVEQLEAGSPVTPAGDPFSELHAGPAWPGALPTKLDELPATADVTERIETYGRDATAELLALNTNLRQCAGTQHPIHPGAVGWEATMDVDLKAGTMRAHDVVLMASTLDERDDMPVLECLTLELKKEVPIPKEWLERLAGKTQFVRRRDLGIPVETDSLYPWLFGKTASEAR